MIALVTGASSGFGFAVCRILREKGYTVYGLSRRGIVPEGVHGLAVDISDKAQVEASIRAITEKEGRLDLLVNNAGMGISGPVEFATQESVEHIMRVNFNGALYCTQAVLPVMRSKGGGHIVFVSSVAADIAIPYQAMYSATKSAVTALALAVRNEVREFGVQVSVVEPGDAKTGFTDSRQKESAHDGIYPHSKTATASMEKDERGGMSADYVAEQIVKVALADNPKPVYIIGGRYKLLCLLFRFLPKRLSYRIVGMMYS